MPAVNVIMPVYRGDEFWARAMQRLSESRGIFGDIVISFDGPDRVRLAQELVDGRGRDIDPVVLVAPVQMSAVEHAVWLIMQEPMASWHPDQLVMFMAEDDLLCPAGLLQGVTAVESVEGGILFGPWARTAGSHDVQAGESLDANGLPGIVRAPDIAPRLASIARNEETTSVSGITMPTRMLRNYFRQLHGSVPGSPLLHGFRTEYFLATQPGVSILIQSSSPIFLVQEHPQQERVVTARRSMNHDEAMYQLWLLFAPQEMHLRDRLAALLRLAKRIAIEPSVTRSLGNGIRTFWRTRNAA